MKTLLVAIVIFLFPVFAQAETQVLSNVQVTTGACTVIKDEDSPYSLKKYTFIWTSNTSGSAAVLLPFLRGRIIQVVTAPASGSEAPSDNYDIVLRGTLADALNGAGANRDTANTEIVAPLVSTYISPAILGPAHFQVSNAGSENRGACEIYIEDK